ncbi:MAG: NnrS family protein [Gammaproteobacteria bacterium]|nr:NnrS family protein [Gammaproteobacteria bacterium]MDH5735227.1 NnrS family protein [Gammaproteobacteria bacterium]
MTHHTSDNRSSFTEVFTAAPHRMMFFAGTIQILIPVLVWLIELTGRHTNLFGTLDTLIPSTWAHGFIMLYGVVTFFIFGFLMTTYPRWMNGNYVTQKQYVSTFIWTSLGIIIFEIGLFSNFALLTSGLAIFIFGLLQGFLALYIVYRNAPAKDKTYETILNAALLAGLSGCLSFLIWIFTDNWLYVQYAMNTGIWLFLLPILITVCHRMIPFFSSCVINDYPVYQPKWSLYLMIISCIGHFLLEISQLPQWLFITDIPLASLAFFHSYKWNLIRSLPIRLLAILHIAFLWLGIGTTLYSIQSLYLFFTGELILGRAPLHSLTIGFISAILIAMATRVSLGHSGRPLEANNYVMSIFIGIELAALLRIFADTTVMNTLSGIHMNIIAATVWIICILLWVIKFAPIYLTPRADGNPG